MGHGQHDAGQQAAEKVVAEVGPDGLAEHPSGAQGEQMFERHEDGREQHEPQAEPQHVDGEGDKAFLCDHDPHVPSTESGWLAEGSCPGYLLPQI